MKTFKFVIFSFCLILFYSCKQEPETTFSSLDPIDWESRATEKVLDSNFNYGETYLSVYSEIYMFSKSRTSTLTATVSMRNINQTDSIYLKSAKYYNSKGELIRNYFKNPIYIAPLETVDIVVDEDDLEGGTGANFIFEWFSSPQLHEPYFDAVMISYGSGQGVSFTTSGIKIK